MKSKYNLYIIYIISFMDLFAIGLMFPLLYPYLRELGASHLVVGILASTYSALQVLTGPLIGSWSDIRGRKHVLLITLSICAICYALLGLTSSIAVIFILRATLGFTKHTQTICKAYIADLLPKEKQAEAYGRSSGFGMLGFVIGPILGGHISQMDNGFSYVCFGTSLLFVSNVVMTFFMPNIPKETEHSVNTSVASLLTMVHKEFLKAFKELIKIDWKVHWDTFLMRFVFGIAVSIFHSSQSMHLSERYNLSQLYIGYTISFLSIVGVICSLSLGKITTKFYKEDRHCLQRIYHSFSTLAICFVGFYLAPNVYIYYTILIPFAVSSTILRIVTTELMITKSKNDEKGSLSGASNSIMSIARFVTPLTTGIIGDIFSENAVMLFGLIPPLFGSILCKYLMKESRLKRD